MLAFLGNFGPLELVLIAVVAVLVFGKDLPQAATKAYMQLRKLRTAVDDLRRDSGIERELRDIERTVREAEWEARRSVPRQVLPGAEARVAPSAVPPEGTNPSPSDPTPSEAARAPDESRGGTPTDAAS